MVTSRLDATFRDPSPQDPESTLFNKDANWIGGRVPDGTAEISSTAMMQGIVTFTQPKTVLGAINLTGSLSLELAVKQTLELTGEGLNLLGGGIGFSGKVVGNAVLRYVDLTRVGYLSSNWDAPAGTIEGSVSNVGGIVNPGRPNVSGPGIMTIDGHYVQGRAEKAGQPPASLMIGFDDTGLACLKVIGRADILANSSVNFGGVQEKPPPLGREFPILTTTDGLNGVFAQKYISDPFQVNLRYDTKNVLATITTT